MSTLSYPDNKSYQLPRKNALVISCMDLRLIDDLLRFLHHDNLANRYDHFILAGASLCATTKHHTLFKPDVLADFTNFEHWRRNLHDHLKLAIALHDIKDVYIVEHQDCGAYTNFLKDGVFASLAQERSCHHLFARELSEEIHAEVHTKRYIDKHGEKQEDSYQLNVHCFMIDLRGNVELLHTTKPELIEEVKP